MEAEQPAGTTAPVDRSVSWTRQADGALVAHVKASTAADDSGTSIEMATYRPPFTGNSPFRFAEFLARTAPDGQSPRAELIAELSDEADNGIILSRILRSTGTSDYAFGLMHVVWFVVGSNAVVINIPRPWTNVRGVSYCSGYNNTGGVIIENPTTYINGSGMCAGTFFYNLSGVHFPLFMFGNTGFGLLGAGNYTVSLGFTAATFDANDYFAGDLWFT